uniref:Solute carrier family 35 (UDP-sugar transporter), member A1/2/3 n=1 Tax=Tetraselmis sp. GSL018 TaxID=582737 RepID=A0A061SGM7_9CHLO|mmetsp:Transcript_33198/g.78736  ORF Transcript_33198/g.78736 Transcript_33198/m.78736 type:complete len:335 (-) Transcript_33198:116-1120(-)|eukprot:CAMPEP_0177583496 /NCGR_PEP_ID=MMETSP0419_2-20121207/3355_1 /TAXON_ID=582737 /ORGANISM="Tetraselmis sp., Strain GSL018" /LENGTH=334 /DNA_ID=CAMNT_0019072895 /DNA_START=219 /DNA_END=1223 /DNA_ORIENTATION=-
MSEISGTTKLGVAVTLTLLTCSQGIMMAASKVDGKYPYNIATVPLFSELTKLIVSAFLLYRCKVKDPKGTQTTFAWRSILLFPIPSIIYIVHNNVQFYTMQYVDAATYQILGNLKIVTTGFLFRVFLKRYLTRIQWMALVLLMCAATTSQISGCGSLLAAPAMGYVFGVLSAWLSAFAGVYTEFLMKKNNDNLYWQNVQLYGFGTLFNAVRLTFDDVAAGFANGPWVTNAFNGYNWVTFMIVLNFAFAGMSVSWIMKFADTIVKVYATSSAMMITALLSVWFFDLQPTLQLFMGIVIACISLNLYFLPPEPVPVQILRPPALSKIAIDGKNSEE